MKKYGVLFDYTGVLADRDGITPAAVKLVRQLHPNFKLGIVTRISRRGVAQALADTGLTDQFDVLITADDTDNFKPHPEAYLLGIKALRLPPDKIIALEDTDSGVRAAYQAGLTYLKIPAAQYLSQITPDQIIDLLDADK